MGALYTEKCVDLPMCADVRQGYCLKIGGPKERADAWQIRCPSVEVVGMFRYIKAMMCYCY